LLDKREVPRDLIEVIKNGECVAFVGAGFVAPVMPDWDGLLRTIAKKSPGVEAIVERLLEAAKESNRGMFDREAAAQILQDNLKGDFVPAIEAILDNHDQGNQELMERRKELLHAIPFQTVLTTNFDSTLPGETGTPRLYRAALREKRNRWFDVVDWDSSKGAHSTPVIQLHGRASAGPQTQDESVVFSRSGYRKLLFENPGYSNFLRAIIATRTILFMGFSFSDAYLNLIRSEVLSLLNPARNTPIAYAILDNLSDDEATFLRNHEGIEPLAYNASGADHRGFDEWLTAIHDQTSPEQIIRDLVKGKRILWVDPNKDNNLFGIRTLEVIGRSDGNISFHATPEDALADLRGHRADLIISHWGFREEAEGGPRGIELLRALRREGVEAPVIFFASLDDTYVNENRARALALGAFEYTHKWPALFGAIEQVFAEI
jgi:CheY-like chemotaxis protein